MDGGALLIVVTLAGAWMIQIGLSTWQMQRFHKTSQKWRRLGSHMAIGVSGNIYKRKTYAVIVTDAVGEVVVAGVLAGFTVMAKPRRVLEVEGLSIDEIGRGHPPVGVPRRAWSAMGHAAGFIRNELAKRESDGRANMTDR